MVKEIEEEKKNNDERENCKRTWPTLLWRSSTYAQYYKERRERI